METTHSRKLMVAGNWKMNANTGFVHHLLEQLQEGIHQWSNQVDMVVFPPFPYLLQAHQQLNTVHSVSRIGLGAQDVSQHSQGAYTGEVSSRMLTDIGVTYALVGHSERRTYHQESNNVVAAKYQALLESHIKPVLCIGETLEERQAEQTLDVVKEQVKAVLDAVGIEGFKQGIIAYEPVWAIGTGHTASAQQAQAVHSAIRAHLSALDEHIAQEVRILYGGSVNGTNALDLFAQQDIDGGLVGGASLTAEDFLAIGVNAPT